MCTLHLTWTSPSVSDSSLPPGFENPCSCRSKAAISAPASFQDDSPPPQSPRIFPWSILFKSKRLLVVVIFLRRPFLVFCSQCRFVVNTIWSPSCVKSRHNTSVTVVRVKWGKMGHFFDYFFNISKFFTKIKNFMNDYAQCVFSLLLQKRKLPLRNERGGHFTPF